MNILEQLKELTVVVADTGDFESMKAFTPRDATTNPSLILAATKDPKYKHLIDQAVSYAQNSSGTDEEKLNLCMDKLSVNFGIEILKIVPQRVSTEVDARLSFDTEATIDKARKLISLYEEAGISKDKILIKIASTWEGIKAAEILEKEGIHCNLTLLFSMPQAIACAEANITLISPFVGRIYDWYKKAQGVDHIPANEDPGVQSVTDIYKYYKKYGYNTEVMGASFRNIGEIMELAGCDLLTISPKLLKELEDTKGQLEQKLNAGNIGDFDNPRIHMDEKTFRWMLNDNAMATEKLAEGIRGFAKDIVTLENTIKQIL